MKFFNRVKTIIEAATQASKKAKEMGLQGDGHGDWYDKSGKLVAKTIGGQLRFFGGRSAGKPMDPADLAPKPEKQAPQQKQQTTQQPEEKEKVDAGSLTVGFGRFNPPTIGHEKLLNAISQTAGKGGQYRVYPSRSQDPKKNPLSPNEKVQYMRQMFPKHANAIIDDDNTKTIFDVLKAANEKGYSTVNIVVGSDRVKEFENLANKYNGQLYNFNKINVVSAGERDADAEGVEGMSASKLRKAALDGDFDTFRSGISKSLDDKTTQQLFNTIRKNMNVKTEEWEVAPKLFPGSLRENYISEKIFQIGSLVENMNHGLIGRIARRGANYVIAITKEGIMFKSWLKDVNEVYEIGTDQYRNHAISITPGQKYPLINKIRQSLKKSRKK